MRHFTLSKYTTFFNLLGGEVSFFLFWIWDGLLDEEEIAGRHNIFGVGALFER